MPSSPRDEHSSNSRGASPRRLIKQVALESPPNSHQLLDATSNVVRSVTREFKMSDARALGSNTNNNNNYNKDDPYVTKRQHLRKVGPFAVDSQSIPDSRIKYAGSWAPQTSASSAHKKNDDDESDDERNDDDEDEDLPPFNYPRAGGAAKAQPAPSNRVSDDNVCHRCSECGVMFEEYSDEEIGIMVTILGTFIHREPSLAAPFLPEILSTVTKYIL